MKLFTASEHMDLCMLARAAGESVYFEPSAVINRLLPPAFPADIQSLPFFFQRWSTTKNTDSVLHFREKWQLPPDDQALHATLRWLNLRRSLVFSPLFRPVKGLKNHIRRGVRWALRVRPT